MREGLVQTAMDRQFFFQKPHENQKFWTDKGRVGLIINLSIFREIPYHWWIQGVPGMPPRDPNSFIIMQFSATKL